MPGLEQIFEEEDEPEKFDLAWTKKRLEKLKWYLWHGNVYQALQMVERLEWDLEEWEACSDKIAQFLKAVQDFGHYIEVNQMPFRTMETDTVMVGPSPLPLWNPRSIRW